MRIPCPYCGDRDVHEFVYRSDAAPQRPAGDAGVAAFHDYVFRRENPAGLIREHWYHLFGCRHWLVVERDTRTHAIGPVALAGSMDQ